jgi:aminoglycoside phosphotransferase (APT) family kinase protein
MAAVCTLRSGRTVFVKAASPMMNLDNVRMIRSEVSVLSALATTAPAPRLLEAIEVPEDGEWTIAVLQHVHGTLPAMPWEPAVLARVREAVWALGAVGAPAVLPSIATRFGDAFVGWRTFAGESSVDGGLDDWSARHLDRLAALEATWLEHARGHELVHGDVRSDNFLLDHGRVTFVDWTSSCVGSGLFDVVSSVPSITLEGGGAPEDVLALHAPEGLDQDAVTALVVACGGYFLDHARLPSPPGLPTVRAFQRAQGKVCSAWLRTRLGWR